MGVPSLFWSRTAEELLELSRCSTQSEELWRSRVSPLPTQNAHNVRFLWVATEDHVPSRGLRQADTQEALRSEGHWRPASHWDRVRVNRIPQNLRPVRR